MKKQTQLNPPFNFHTCGINDCTKASSCLRQEAYRQLLKESTYLHIVNPTFCSKDGNCTYFKDNTPVTFARGFTQLQNRMLPIQYNEFSAKMMSYFSRNGYYERRNGKIPLSPAEQILVRKVARSVGIPEDFSFDAYEQAVQWND